MSHNKELFEKLDIFINSFDDKDKNLFSILHYAQNIFGCITNDIQAYISKKLDIPIERITNLTNFYSYFNTEVKGELKIKVCFGRACSKNNADKLLNEFENILNIKAGETTSDLKFTLETSNCIGICHQGPIVTINGKPYKDVKLEEISSILNMYN